MHSFQNKVINGYAEVIFATIDFITSINLPDLATSTLSRHIRRINVTIIVSPTLPQVCVCCLVRWSLCPDGQMIRNCQDTFVVDLLDTDSLNQINLVDNHDNDIVDLMYH